jgi:8-oxo-dGTP diphosphatase
MQLYSLGLVFDSTCTKVLLMHKTRPDWQKGKLNGIGGKVEEGEDNLGCMVRETFEETGLLIPPDEWVNFASIKDTYGLVGVYAAVYKGLLSDAKTAEDQKVEWILVSSLPENVIRNLTWLIPAGLDVIENKSFKKILVEY